MLVLSLPLAAAPALELALALRLALALALRLALALVLRLALALALRLVLVLALRMALALAMTVVPGRYRYRGVATIPPDGAAIPLLPWQTARVELALLAWRR